MKKPLLLFIFGILSLSIISGCGIFGKKDKAWAPVKPQAKSFIHTVQWPQETLQIIAKWYTGDVKNGTLLANANPAIDPHHLVSGDKIYIPSNLLKNKKPLTKQYMISRNRAKKKNEQKVKQSVNTEKKKDDIILFGPK